MAYRTHYAAGDPHSGRTMAAGRTAILSRRNRVAKSMSREDNRHLLQLRSAILWAALLSIAAWAAIIALLT